MKNPFLSPADFWQERDFGKKISAAFDFIGAHFKPLLKCLAYFVLPFSMLAGIGFGLFFNVLYNQLGATMHPGSTPGGVVTTPVNFGGTPFTFTSLVGIGIGAIGGLLAYIILSSTVYGYMRARLAHPPTTPITPTLVWVEMRAQVGRLLLAGLLTVGLSGLVTVVLFAVVGGSIAQVMAGMNSGYAVLGLFLVWLLLVYVGITLSLYLPVLFLEDLSVWATFGRCFQLIRGKWWSTFGLLLTATFLQTMLTYVFAIPQYAVMAGKAGQIPTLDSDILGVVASSIYAIGGIFTYTLPLLALAFQYFNLVERREGRGLHLLVDQLGTPAAALPAVQSDYYRPDDEGEY